MSTHDIANRFAPHLKWITSWSLGSLNVTASAALALLLVVTAGIAAGRDPNLLVLPPNATFRGRSYGDWAAAWWARTLQVPLERNPLMDPRGVNGSADQKGPVWFLAGAFEGSVERFITIPGGKQILFPVFNVFNDYSCPAPGSQPRPGQTLEEFLTEGAEAMTDMATELFAEVDGVPILNLWDYRTHSELVMLAKHPSLMPLVPCQAGGPQPAVVGGYWLMLAPLLKGQHTIRFGSTASLGDFEFRAETTYYVTIE